MKILKEGYTYELSSLEGINAQQIQFIEKDHSPECVGQLKTICDGTTNEEVLEMLIHRLKYQNNVVPSRETSIAITKLEECYMWIEKRTNDRKKRGVYGTSLK